MRTIPQTTSLQRKQGFYPTESRMHQSPNRTVMRPAGGPPQSSMESTPGPPSRGVMTIQMDCSLRDQSVDSGMQARCLTGCGNYTGWGSILCYRTEKSQSRGPVKSIYAYDKVARANLYVFFTPHTSRATVGEDGSRKDERADKSEVRSRKASLLQTRVSRLSYFRPISAKIVSTALPTSTPLMNNTSPTLLVGGPFHCQHVIFYVSFHVLLITILLSIMWMPCTASFKAVGWGVDTARRG